MARFQWYVVDLNDGTVTGSNDVEEVLTFIDNEEYVIFSAQHGIYFCGSREEKEISAIAESREYPDPEYPEEE